MRTLQLTASLFFAARGALSLQTITAADPQVRQAFAPTCDQLLHTDGAAALLRAGGRADLHVKNPASGEARIVLALDGGGHSFALNPKNMTLLVLTEAQREVSRLQTLWPASRALQPSGVAVRRESSGRGSDHATPASFAPITPSGAVLTQGDTEQIPAADDELLELRARLKEACLKVRQLEQALSESQDIAHELTLDNFEIARERSQKPLPPSVPLADEETFDIVVNAFKRDMELEWSLKNYLDCKQSLPIAKIHVVWNDWNRTIPSNLTKLNVSYFVPPGRNTHISNRYWPLDFASNAVFHVDDDVPHFCEILSDLFQLWKSDVDGIVGTSPRLLDLSAGGLDGYAVPLVHGQYNAVWVTKGAMVHRRFFDEYWKPVWSSLRDVVNAYNCAEDMLFSAVHKTIVGKGHVYAVAASVNHGKRVLLEGYTLYSTLNKVESYIGLNVRTWGVRGLAGEKIGRFLQNFFKEQVRQGIYYDITKKFWRSTVHSDLSCRQLPLPCYNRDWPECWEECGDDAVRGTNVCFRGDSACFAGLGMSLGLDVGENMMVVCVAGNCTALLQDEPKPRGGRGRREKGIVA